MAQRWSVGLDDGRVCHVVWTDSSDGDFEARRPNKDLERRRSSIVDLPWNWLDQVHGTKVIAVERPGQASGMQGDGLWTAHSDCPLSITTADCAPLVLVAGRGCAVVHAGWRGVFDGIVGQAAAALIDSGAPVAAVLGPCISPQAYEFGSQDLAKIAARLGPSVIGETAEGAPALDMAAAVGVACVEAGWPAPEGSPCTSDPRWYSYRTRSDKARQATVCWLESS